MPWYTEQHFDGIYWSENSCTSARNSHTLNSNTNSRYSCLAAIIIVIVSLVSIEYHVRNYITKKKLNFHPLRRESFFVLRVFPNSVPKDAEFICADFNHFNGNSFILLHIFVFFTFWRDLNISCGREEAKNRRKKNILNYSASTRKEK